MGSKYLMSLIQSNVKTQGIWEICPWKAGVATKMAWEHLWIWNHPRVLGWGGHTRTAGLTASRATLRPWTPWQGATLPSAATLQAACCSTLSPSHWRGALACRTVASWGCPEQDTAGQLGAGGKCAWGRDRQEASLLEEESLADGMSPGLAVDRRDPLGQQCGQTRQVELRGRGGLLSIISWAKVPLKDPAHWSLWLGPGKCFLVSQSQFFGNRCLEMGDHLLQWDSLPKSNHVIFFLDTLQWLPVTRV